MAEVLLLLIFIIIVCASAYFLYYKYVYFPPIEEKRLRNKRVIITGASRGIGEELAYEYSRYHCRLVLAARSIDKLRNQIAEKCRALGATQVECVEYDASKEESCIQLIKQTVEYYQGIDIIVLNHTASVYEPFFKSSIKTNIENMKKLMNTNFYGYFLTAMESLPYLAESGTSETSSQIIAVSSITGCCPLPKTTIYGTTKHAIEGFFLNLARELQISEPYKNRVTATVASLGLIGTELALSSTNKQLHFFAADIRKTAQAIIAAGIHGQAHLFYPYPFAALPPIYFIFTCLFERASRLSC